MKTKHKDYIEGFASGSVTGVKAAEGDKLPTIDILAYTGGILGQWFGDVVVDLKGMQVPDNVALLSGRHDDNSPVGHAGNAQVKISDNQIIIEGGVLSGDPEDPATRKIIVMGKNGFPWQASIGAPILQTERIEKGATVEVNGQKFEGPIIIARKTLLKEVTILTFGADDKTVSKVAAQEISSTQIQGESMGTEANGDLAGSQSPKIEASAPVSTQAQAELETLRAQVAELNRVNSINAVAGDHAEIKATALKEKWTVDQVKATIAEVEKIHASRPTPMFNITGKSGNAEGAIEAGFAMACGVKAEALKGEYSDDALTDSNKVKASSFSHLAQLLLVQAGQFNPVHGKEDMLRAAFSTVGLSNVLSNTANKILLSAYEAAPSNIEKVAMPMGVSDFKAVSLNDMTMDLTLRKIGINGEADHATMADSAQSAKIDSFARQAVIDRQMLINDDLGAFQRLFAGFGKGAMVAKMRNFWTVFKAATPFSGNALTSLPLNIDNFTTALAKIRSQVDENGDPINLGLLKLVVPTGLETYAKQLMSSMALNETTTANTPKPAMNPHVGAAEVVVEPYLNNTNVSGGSATTWYLVADALTAPVFVDLFLISAPSPVVRQQATAVGSFGVATDCVYDFGASAVTAKSKGLVKCSA